MRRSLPLVLTLLLGLVFVSCTGGSRNQENRGNTFYRNLSGEPTTLHPIMSTDLYSTRVQAYVLETLLSRNIDTYEWQPALAEKWEISEDQQEFTFHLRKNAVFHDGKPVTAEDVKFSFDAIFEPKYLAAHLRPYYENIAGVEIVDTHTVKMKAKEPYFNNFAVAAGLAVIPKHIYEDVESSRKMTQTIIGSGPYKIGEYNKGNRLILQKVENWYGDEFEENKGQNNFDQIVFRFVQDQVPAIQMLLRGDLDFQELSTDGYAVHAQGARWGKDVHKYAVENRVPKSYGYIGWNLRKPMFQDKNVRIALAHLLNREVINERFRHGLSHLATGPLYVQSEYANPDVKPIPFDIEAARKLLAEAGWADTNKDGVLDKELDGNRTDFRFTLLYPSKEVERYWTLYQQDLRKAGIDMSIRLVEWQAFRQLVDEGNFDAIAMAWGGGSIDWDPKQIWHSDSATDGGSNFIGYKNPEVDKLIDQARVEFDREKRVKILRQVYKLIAEDAPYVFLFNDKYYHYANTDRIQKPKDTFLYDVGLGYWSIKQAE